MGTSPITVLLAFMSLLTPSQALGIIDRKCESMTTCRLSAAETDPQLIDYLEIDKPRVRSRPIIIAPDSLSAVKQEVRVFVKLVVDREGTPVSGAVLKSSDYRFNQAALRFALQYRFDISNVPLKGNKVYISVPIVFNRTSK
jgi:TonB family protein